MARKKVDLVLDFIRDNPGSIIDTITAWTTLPFDAVEGAVLKLEREGCVEWDNESYGWEFVKEREVATKGHTRKKRAEQKESKRDKRPGPGKAGLCDLCRRERPHINHVSRDSGTTWSYECPECSALATADHLLRPPGTGASLEAREAGEGGA